jgi:pilus assembly protein CpaE
MAEAPIFCDPDPVVAAALRDASGGEGVIFTDLGALRDHLMVSFEVDTIVLGPGIDHGDAFAVADYLRLHRPRLGVILVRDGDINHLLQDALRSGLLDLVERKDEQGLSEAINRSAHVASSRRRSGAEQSAMTPPSVEQPAGRGRVITVFSAKGGSGKTTFATNLAAVLADRGHRQVCILDLDLAFGDVAIAMQLFPVHTIADAVPLNGAIDSSAVAAMLTHHSAGLGAIVAPTEPSASETIQAGLISRLLDVLRNEFDYIVVDTPASFDDEVLAALDVSDLITLIVTPDVPALKTLKITLETLIELSYSRNKFRLVLNRSDAKVGISHTEVEKTAQMSITGLIPSSRDVPSSINRGVPIVQDDPKHRVSVGIRDFAQSEVIGSGVPKGENGGRGWTKRRPRS